jgi:long-subunit acyl-CoA synthetase (AMP-forming)
LLEAARELGLPAHEGYGLSEGASVQTLNLPGADRPGSAGRVLPHARLRIAADGEIELGGALHLGYLGSDTPVPQWWPSGDLGEIDVDGFLHVHGRKKQVLITAFGRNVSPEWVECELHAATVRGLPAVVQAVVFGDGEPSLSAVLWPLRPEMTDAVLQAAVDAANARLPDYAQVRHWVRSTYPFTAESGLATANGRPRRDAIAERHAASLHAVATA